MRSYEPNGRDPREPARWKMGGTAPVYGCLILLIVGLALLLSIVGLAWWALS